jgi:hypothetical protein
MVIKSEKKPKKSADAESPCGTGCPDFVAKTCPGEDKGCAIYWRFSESLS